MRLETERVVKRAGKAVRHPDATAVVQVDAIRIEAPLPDDLHMGDRNVLTSPHRNVVEERVADHNAVYLHVAAVFEIERVPPLCVLHGFMPVAGRGEENLLLDPAHIDDAAAQNRDVRRV